MDSGLIMGAVVALFAAGIVRRKELFVFRWQPEGHTRAAVATGFLAVGFSALVLFAPMDSTPGSAIVWLGIFLGCGSLAPWAYVLLVEDGGPSALGLRREGSGKSLALSVLFGVGLIAVLLERTQARLPDLEWFLPASAFFLVAGLFELFLYYGFIHLRLLKAFGFLPAVFVSSGIYALWHIGTELPLHDDPLAALGMLYCVGILMHSIFSLTRNLLIIWPFTYLPGVMLDFVANLDAPSLVVGQNGWGAFGAVMMLAIPLGCLDLQRRRRRTILQPV